MNIHEGPMLSGTIELALWPNRQYTFNGRLLRDLNDRNILVRAIYKDCY